MFIYESLFLVLLLWEGRVRNGPQGLAHTRPVPSRGAAQPSPSFLLYIISPRFSTCLVTEIVL